MWQEALIAKIVGAFEANDALPRALFLSGSLGAGNGDTYSDIDFLAVVDETQSGRFIESWMAIMDEALPVARWLSVPFKPNIVNLITDDWARVDIHVVESVNAAGVPRDRLRPLVDPENLHVQFPATLADSGSAARIEAAIIEFIRVLGLLPLGVGREEFEVALTGVGLQRNALAELMRTDSGIVGGMLSWRRQIRPDHYAQLAALPVAQASRESIIAANVAIAEAFIPLARRMAKDHGIEWPERFWQATRQKLASELSIVLDV